MSELDEALDLHRAGRLDEAAAGHLALSGRADIALDPFPCNGATATCDSLWMGVPVITLAGHVHASRAGTSLLTRAALPDLVADSTAGHVEKAVAPARDPHRLRTVRWSLRERLFASPVMDAPGFAADVESAYRRMVARRG